MSEATGRTVRSSVILLLLVTLLPMTAVAANDPGHDTLYVLKLGDSNVAGSINLTGTLNASYVRAAALLYGDLLDIRANGSIQTPSSRPAIQSDANDLYIDSRQNVYLNTRAGTTGLVQIGPTTGASLTLNVSGIIKQQNVQVCLQNGTYCPSSLSASNITGSGSTGYLARWTSSADIGNGLLYDSGSAVGLGTAGPLSALHVNSSSGAGSLRVQNTTGSAHLFVNGSTGFVGIGTLSPAQAFDVVGSIATSGTTRISSSGVGSFATGTTINSLNVCLADGTNCFVANTNAGGGWLNTSGAGNVSLANENANVSANALLIDNANARVLVNPRALTSAGTTLAISGNLSVSSGNPGITASSGLDGSVAENLRLVNTGIGSAGVSLTFYRTSTELGRISSQGSQVWISTGGATDKMLAVDGSGNVSINTDGFFFDAVANRTGIGTSTPSQYVQVAGNYSSTGGGVVDIANTIYTNTTFTYGLFLHPSFQTYNNTVVLVGLGVAPNFVSNNKTITRVETLRIAPALATSFNGTVTTLEGLKIIDAAVNNGSIGTQRGINVQDMTSGTANNYGIVTAVSSGTGKYNIYASGTADNFFAGNVGAGTTGPTQALSVNGSANVTASLYLGSTTEVTNGFSDFNYTAGDVSTTSNTVYTRLNVSLNLSATSVYIIDCDLISDAGAATTGVVLGVNLTGSPTSVRATYSSPGVTTAGAVSVETFSGTNTGTNLFSDADSTTTPYVAKLVGYVVTGANTASWNVDLRSETNGVAVNVRAGSFCRATQAG